MKKTLTAVLAMCAFAFAVNAADPAPVANGSKVAIKAGWTHDVFKDGSDKYKGNLWNVGAEYKYLTIGELYGRLGVDYTFGTSKLSSNKAIKYKNNNWDFMGALGWNFGFNEDNTRVSPYVGFGYRTYKHKFKNTVMSDTFKGPFVMIGVDLMHNFTNNFSAGLDLGIGMEKDKETVKATTAQTFKMKNRLFWQARVPVLYTYENWVFGVELFYKQLNRKYKDSNVKANQTQFGAALTAGYTF